MFLSHDFIYKFIINIPLSVMLIGFLEEIRSKIYEIIKFAELEKFIYMAIITYSSSILLKLVFLL